MFVYGSLRVPAIFKSVCGLSFSKKRSSTDEETLFAEPALLSGYRKVSPDNVYFYAVAIKSSRIEGFVIYDVPSSSIAEIDRYEGKRYQRETVSVNTGKGIVEAQAYLTSNESMKEHFGDRFHVNLIHELWLRKRIDRFIRKHTRPGERTVDAELERKAQRELLATTERDLVMSHYGTTTVSDYFLSHELDRPNPSIRALYDDEHARGFIQNYLAMVVKQVLFNQIDDRIQSRYRFELEHMQTSERYFKRTISLVVALRIINSNKETVNLIIDKCLETMPYRENDLIDYIKYAIRAAASLFDHRVVLSGLERIRANLSPGLIPLGAEIEMSNLGAFAVDTERDGRKRVDTVYDGFYYFHDFKLDLLSWKVGGYIDDHTGSTDFARRRGFLEFAAGRLNIAGELSRPTTNDPWLLNQLINSLVAFYDVTPHSLHLSFQLLRHQIGKQKQLPLDFIKCLLVLGGDPRKRGTRKLWISRMGYDEITQTGEQEELVFTRTSKRKWHLGVDEIGSRSPVQATTYIQQYKFIRLKKRANYEPLIMCLKGFQLEYNPADYFTAEQFQHDKKLREEYEELKKWSASPGEISGTVINRFISTVQKGLMSERHYRPAHKLHYIEWCLNAIGNKLRTFNEQVKYSHNVP